MKSRVNTHRVLFLLVRIATWQPTHPWSLQNVQCQKRITPADNSLPVIFWNRVCFVLSYVHIFSCSRCIPISWKDPGKHRALWWPRGSMPAKDVELLVKVTKHYRMDRLSTVIHLAGAHKQTADGSYISWRNLMSSNNSSTTQHRGA